MPKTRSSPLPPSCIRLTNALSNLVCTSTSTTAPSSHPPIPLSGSSTLSQNASLTAHIRTTAHETPHLTVHTLFAAHGSPTAAHLCARNFTPTLLEDDILPHNAPAALENACQAMEAFVLAKSAIDRAYYGTTLLAAVVQRATLHLANIGNSRAVLVDRSMRAMPLTDPHDDSNGAEVERVVRAGGFFKNGMVNNLVRVTRSIGDMEFKQRKHLNFPNTNSADIIIPTPDIRQVALQEEHHYLVMTTAEIQRFLTDASVVHIVSTGLRRRDTPESCADRVAEAAFAAGAKGPLAVLVVVLSDGGRDTAPLPFEHGEREKEGRVGRFARRAAQARNKRLSARIARGRFEGTGAGSSGALTDSPRKGKGKRTVSCGLEFESQSGLQQHVEKVRMSELTGSTAVRFDGERDDDEMMIEYSAAGPSKVRYREDGSVHSKFPFLSHVKEMVRRR